jgi:hypothetical protein
LSPVGIRTLHGGIGYINRRAYEKDAGDYYTDAIDYTDVLIAISEKASEIVFYTARSESTRVVGYKKINFTLENLVGRLNCLISVPHDFLLDHFWESIELLPRLEVIDGLGVGCLHPWQPSSDVRSSRP